VAAEAYGLAGPENFYFTNQGRTYDADGQDDPKDYLEVRVRTERRTCRAPRGG